MAIKVRPKQALMSLPMIPVISVVFNLLMVFIMAPSASSREGYLTTNLPTSSGPVAGKPQLTEVNIRVKLFDVSPNGEYIDNAKNEYCSIEVEGRNLGSDFDALQKFLEEKRAQGLSETTPILLAPTMPTLHEWVVRAFDAAVAARFTKIQFAVPYV